MRCWRNLKSHMPPLWEDWEIPLMTAHCMGLCTAKLVSTATSKPLRTSRLLEETLSLEEISLKGKAIMWSPQLLLVFPMIHLLFTGRHLHQLCTCCSAQASTT